MSAFLESSLASAVGWALLHSFWQGAIVALLLALLLAAIRSPRLRYGFACGALACMAGCFIVTLLLMMPAADSGMGHAAPAALAAVFRGAIAPPSADADLGAVTPWLALVWTSGVALFYLWQAAGWISVNRLRRRGVCVASQAWQQRLAVLRTQLRVSRPVQLLESCFVDAPIVLGHFRPVILLPIGLLTGLPANQIEAVLLHELAHVQRHDYLVNLLQRVVEGLLFYHPAVWWIGRVIRVERENCCDDVAVALSGDVHGYASALAALEGNRQASSELAMAATRGNLMKRIQRLLSPRKTAGTLAPFVATLILMLATAAVLPAWQAPTDPESTPYMKWMNEDVAYIITPVERASFLKLTADADREKFIEQFWVRRNPVPGQSENPVKLAHYRRLAYSNERFEGWRSDRGRMYIVYGPPDEIESHPTARAGSLAREVWMYHAISGVGERVFLTFVEENGLYKLAPGNGK